jgi:uncharacterized membrane protein YraQ (UPF0718 family)
LLTIVALIIATVFLSLSRTPALDQKARMGSRTDISSIAFETLFDVSQQQSFPERVFKSTINWTYTNWKGMTFGILFGATLLSLLRLLPLWRLPKNGFLAALQGLIGGAPLGVCVNCATPIAQGLHRAGIKLETMLAVMTASPTLNLIVITMMFSLFSIEFVVIKLVATIFFISVVIPTTVWFWSRYARTEISGDGYKIPVTVPPSSDSYIPDHSSESTWLEAALSSITELLKNLRFLLRITLPLMLLAGFLGAILIESISLERVAELPVKLTSYALLAVIGTFLPVPIAFDVVITSVLISVGLPPGLAMTLFFSLSIFSIFPILIVGQDVSFKLSGTLAILVIIVSIAAGLITTKVHEARVAGEAVQIETALSQLTVNQTFQLKDPIELASSLCADNFDDVESCLKDLLFKETFGNPDEKLCQQVELSRPVLANSCREELATRKQAILAIQSNDIKICQDYSCRMVYLKTNSHKSTSLTQCDLNLTGPEIQLCRKLILQYRITYFRSNEACGLELSDEESVSCQRGVETQVAIEQINLDACRKLQQDKAATSCLIAVSSMKVAEYGEDFSCTTLRDPFAEKVCLSQQIKVQALSDLSTEQCRELTGREVNRCLTEVISARVLSSQTRIPDIEGINVETPYRTPKPDKIDLPPPIKYQRVFDDGRVSIAMAAPVTGSPERAAEISGKFLRHSPEQTNLSFSWNINSTDLFEPFLYGKGISSGDINNDGYPDLVVAFERGIYVYNNLGDGTFGLATTLLPANGFNTFVVALIDINNDGWLDLFSSGYGGKQLLYLNSQGSFNSDSSENEPIHIPDSGGSTTMAAGFADLDQDGDLDMVLGKWAHGIERNFRTSGGNNELWLNQSGTLEKFSLFDAEPAGPTLTVLLSDLNEDSIPDIVIGNDRQVPDIYYFSMEPLVYSHPLRGTIPQTSLNTMSYESADFNNDLKLDIFSSDMTFNEIGRQDYCESVPNNKEKNQCLSLVEISREVGNYNVAWCHTLSINKQLECLTATMIKIAVRDKNSELCNKIPPEFPAKKQYCLNATGNIPPDKDVNLEAYPPQLTSNKFLMSWGKRFIDVTNDVGVSRSNWSWNTRAFDADNDRYQDIYIGSGYGFGAMDDNDFTIDLQVFPNTLFHSQSGRKFIRAESAFGVESYINTTAYTLTDYDLDGDLDVIEYGQFTGINVLENQISNNQTISFALIDDQGNKFCIGCKIIITSQSGKQLREIKASGGFLSFNEPIAQFGLAHDETVDGIEIYWSTGEKSTLEVSLKANNRFRIRRH